MGNEALQGADVSKLVEDLLEDTDMAKFFDEEFEVSAWRVFRGITHGICLPVVIIEEFEISGWRVLRDIAHGVYLPVVIVEAFEVCAWRVLHDIAYTYR